MSFKAAPFPKNEKRRAETVAKIDLIDEHEDALFYSYCELGKVLSGFDFAAVTVMTADMQCSLSSSDGTRDEGEREASICQYAILDPEPTIVYELQDHPIFSKQRITKVPVYTRTRTSVLVIFNNTTARRIIVAVLTGITTTNQVVLVEKSENHQGNKCHKRNN